MDRNWQRARKYLVFMLILTLVKAAHYGTMRVSDEDLQGERDLDSRMSYLDGAVRSMTLEDMPDTIGELFQREWYMGTYAMTAMAVTNRAFMTGQGDDEARESLEFLVAAMLRPETRAFDAMMWHGEDALASLDGPNGHIGFLGHLNMALLAQRYLGVTTHDELLMLVNDALRRRLVSSEIGLIETYPGEIYLSDNVTVLAGLHLAHAYFPERGYDIAGAWIETVAPLYIDPETGVLAFSASRDGSYATPSRGSGAFWNVFYLSYIDQEFARNQYEKAKAAFYDHPLPGIGGMREWRHGLDLPGDVDSGPVMFGLSPSGSGFAIAGATMAGDQEVLAELLRSGEILGSTVNWGSGRRYLFAPMVGDAIIMAMRTVTPWDPEKFRNVLVISL